MECAVGGQPAGQREVCAGVPGGALGPVAGADADAGCRAPGGDPGQPGFSIGFGWYPGRVGWIHNGPSVGWVPLAPDEIYYGYRPWGHRTVVVRQSTVINPSLIRYRYLDEAVIIHRDHFYKGNRYTPYVQPNIGRAVIINNYQPAPVINNTIINNYDTDKRRFTLNDAKISRKPHATVMNRINNNQKLIQGTGRFNRERIEQDLTRINIATQPQPKTDVRAPMLATKLVDSEKIAKPINTESLQKKEIKPKNRERHLFSDNDQQRGQRDQGATGQSRNTANQDDSGRIRAARETRNQLMEQTQTKTPSQADDKQLAPPDRQVPDQARETGKQEDKPQINSPRVSQPQGDGQKAAETTPRPVDQQRNLRDREELDQARGNANQEENRRIRSPREAQTQDSEQAIQQRDQTRRLEESKQRQEQEVQQRRQAEVQQRQEQEVQQRRQAEVQQRQEQEVQQRRQAEVQQRQEQEVQQRRQVEAQRRQEQEMQQRRQAEVSNARSRRCSSAGRQKFSNARSRRCSSAGR